LVCRYFAQDGTIDIRVGKGDAAKTFTVDKELLCASSEYFKDRRRSSRGILLHLTEDDPLAFDMLAHWLVQKDEPIFYRPNQYSGEPWRSLSASAWFLATKLCATQFKKYALSQFVQNCALSDLSTWEHIENTSPPKSSMRRFSDHWIAWNYHLAGAGPSEYEGTEAAKRAKLVTATTRDPRIYDLEHWYSDCGEDLNPGCSHDPIVRAAALQAASRIKPPPSELGRDWEAQRNNSSNNRSSYLPQPTINSSRHGNGHLPTLSRQYPSPPASSYSRPITVRMSNFISSLDTIDASKWTRNVLGVIFMVLDHKYFADGSQAIFAVQIIANIALSVTLLRRSGAGIRYTTATYSLFTACVGGLSVFVLFVPFVPMAFFVYGFFGFADGIATAVDAHSCQVVSTFCKLSHSSCCS
jgi:hypothetical protein